MPAANNVPDVRDRILDEATRLFSARGFDGTSLAEVADAVGLRKPSLMYHFESKDALRRAVMEKLLGHWNDVLPRLLLAATSGEGRFDAVVGEMIGFFSADPDRARLLVRESLDRPEGMRELVISHTPPWVSMVCNYIRRGQAEGLIHADVDPEAYVVQVVNLVIAGVATWDCIGAMAGTPAQKGRHPRPPSRHVAEMLRVAKAALFVGAGAARATTTTKATRRKRPAATINRAKRTPRG